MVALYTVEVGGKPRGPLTGYQVLKLFDAGEVGKDSRISVETDPKGGVESPYRSLGESRLFARFDQLRGAAATPPSVFLQELAQAVTAQTQELQAMRRHLLWLRITVGLMFLGMVLFGWSFGVRITIG